MCIVGIDLLHGIRAVRGETINQLKYLFKLTALGTIELKNRMIMVPIGGRYRLKRMN